MTPSPMPTSQCMSRDATASRPAAGESRTPLGPDAKARVRPRGPCDRRSPRRLPCVVQLRGGPHGDAPMLPRRSSLAIPSGNLGLTSTRTSTGVMGTPCDEVRTPAVQAGRCACQRRAGWDPSREGGGRPARGRVPSSRARSPGRGRAGSRGRHRADARCPSGPSGWDPTASEGKKRRAACASPSPGSTARLRCQGATLAARHASPYQPIPVLTWSAPRAGTPRGLDGTQSPCLSHIRPARAILEGPSRPWGTLPSPHR